MRSIKSLEEIKIPGARSAVALGLFDGLHLGHRAVIGAAVETARREGRPSLVFTFSVDGESCPAAKSPAGRLFTPELRESLLADMGVDMMLCPPFEAVKELSARQFVREILAGRLGAGDVFSGADYRFGKAAAGTAEDLTRLSAEYGIAAHTLPLVSAGGEPVSSTRIRALVAEGDMPSARELLGRSYAIDFEVIPGRQLGRTLDSPTINQPIPAWYSIPRFGVYASFTTVDGKRHPSVSNVGRKPTVGSDTLLSETYIQGFDGDLYGRHILVEFLEFIRPEVKFASTLELRAQIQKDSEAARAVCARY